ncbi:hypothetical protein [Benzoatithermus flavus]|uniref:Uncharacterized protein n=1 Tax=Benzoatithermus flavus TaxID=3108223 RepID=A0ABU8XMW4_9PROT
MAASGILIATAGLSLPGMPKLTMLAVGLLLAALAALPLARTIEQRERAEGLAVLEEEWRTLAARGEQEAHQAFVELIARLHRRPARG